MKAPSMILHSALAMQFLLLSFLPSESAGVDTINSLLFRNSMESSIPSNAKWSFSAIDIATGKKIISAGNSQDIPLIPGSCMKLYLSAAILDLYTKENFEPAAIVSHDGVVFHRKLLGNLYLKGSGDAFISEGDLRRASEEVTSRNILEVAGDIVLDDLLFDTQGLSRIYYGPAYPAPAALGLDMHTVSISADGSPAGFKVSPLNNEVKITSVSGFKPAIRQIDDLTYEFSGSAFDSEIVRYRFPLNDPAYYAALTFKSLLSSRGVSINGMVRRGEMPGDTTEVLKISSKSIPDMIRDMNFNSLNVAADNLFLVIGAKQFGPPGTRTKGVSAIRTFLKELGVPAAGMSIADGSGLSQHNRTTSDQIAEFLARASDQRWFTIFHESLPRAGLDGTLRNTGHKNERIRAKTGQLRDANCLAGYIDKNNQSKMAFALIVNVPGADLLWGSIWSVFKLLEGIADDAI
jgi:serine-type D-Ala-D-Ala carboxypeptidase/endopeptidase (penicillin-binding protein 4)